MLFLGIVLSLKLAPAFSWVRRLLSRSHVTSHMATGHGQRYIATHIFFNVQAYYHGLQRFVGNCNVLIRTDNTTFLTCINKTDNVKLPYFNALTRKIWIFICYNPSFQNCVIHRNRVVAE